MFQLDMTSLSTDLDVHEGSKQQNAKEWTKGRDGWHEEGRKRNKMIARMVRS